MQTLSTADLIKQGQELQKLAGKALAGGDDMKTKAQALISMGAWPEFFMSERRAKFLTHFLSLSPETREKYLKGEFIAKEHSLITFREAVSGNKQIDLFKQDDNIIKHLRNVEAATLRLEKAFLADTISLRYFQGQDVIDFSGQEFPQKLWGAGMVTLKVDEKVRFQAFLESAAQSEKKNGNDFDPTNLRFYLEEAIPIERNELIELELEFASQIGDPQPGKKQFFKLALEGTALRAK
ncbi:MAG: hypothetical protein AAF599_00010 [Bacteroidota bacterium]